MEWMEKSGMAGKKWNGWKKVEWIFSKFQADPESMIF